MKRCEDIQERVKPTPANADKHPLSEFIGGVGEDHGGVQVTSFTKHPEEVGHMEVVIGCSHQPAPHLRRRRMSG